MMCQVNPALNLSFLCIKLLSQTSHLHTHSTLFVTLVSLAQLPIVASITSRTGLFANHCFITVWHTHPIAFTICLSVKVISGRFLLGWCYRFTVDLILIAY